MIDLQALQEVDIQDPMAWPPWFTWAIGVVLAVAIVGAGWYFLLDAQQVELNEAEQQESILAASYAAEAKKVRLLPAYLIQKEQVQAMLNDMLKALPDDDEMASLLTTITEAALEQGLRLPLFEPLEPVEAGYYAEVDINIEVVGGFHQVAQFISTVSSMDRIVTVSKLTVGEGNPNDRTSSEDLVTSATLKTYHYLGDQPDKVADPG